MKHLWWQVRNFGLMRRAGNRTEDDWYISSRARSIHSFFGYLEHVFCMKIPLRTPRATLSNITLHVRKQEPNLSWSCLLPFQESDVVSFSLRHSPYWYVRMQSLCNLAFWSLEGVLTNVAESHTLSSLAWLNRVMSQPCTSAGEKIISDRLFANRSASFPSSTDTWLQTVSAKDAILWLVN